MPLPKIDQPLFDMVIPSTGKKVTFRPFLVKEEKILLMAMESEDDAAVLLAIKQIVNNCCVEDMDVDSLPVLDLEYMFLQLRARSIGEVVNLKYKCNNDVTDDGAEESHKCNNVVEIDLNILGIEPEKQEGHTNKIEITEKMGIIMKDPNFETQIYILDEKI
jgi:hypothetical protein